jgi:hypothetical protein
LIAAVCLSESVFLSVFLSLNSSILLYLPKNLQLYTVLLKRKST